MYKKIQLVREVISSPHVTIACFGEAGAREIWKYFTSRHPKLPLFKRKTFGAALHAIPSDPGALAEGSRFTLMRRKIRKAERAGYTFRQIDAAAHFGEIMAINLSSASRQGSEMTSEYIDANLVKAEMAKSGDWFGIFSKSGTLQAYAYTPVFGDAFVFWKILGNSALLDDGIMYLLVYGVIREMSVRRTRDGYPAWAMYDMYIGGGDGLREFKRRTGFFPRRVTWRWSDDAKRRVSG